MGAERPVDMVASEAELDGIQAGLPMEPHIYQCMAVVSAAKPALHQVALVEHDVDTQLVRLWYTR